MSTTWENIEDFWMKALKEKTLKNLLYSHDSLLERDDTVWEKYFKKP